MPYVKLEKSHIAPDSGKNIIAATDVPHGCWRLLCEKNKKIIWEIFIYVNQMDIEPIVLSTTENIIFLGVEKLVFCVNEQTGEIKSHIGDLTFVQSIEVLSQKNVLISAEDEVIMFKSNGDFMWRVNLPGIIQDIKEVSNKLQIELDSGEELSLERETGLALDL